MDTRLELLAEIDNFLNMNPDVSATSFGLAVANDGHLVHRLRNGRNITLKSVDAIRNFIAQHNSAKQAVNSDHSSAA